MINIVNSDNGIVATCLRNNEIKEAFAIVFDECVKRYGSKPVLFEVLSWDEAYGDIQPDGYIVAKPTYGEGK